ncbi:MAG: hypothetical protein CL609_08880 [Anaerolineaceae bacterium]|nr:hypothetical protein [Anaerolineaceae bacterium]
MPIKNLFDETRTVERRRSVMLTVTEACNLRCKYCYEAFKPQRNMSFQIAQETINRFMKMDDGFDFVEFDFFGGEPLLNFKLIRDLVDWFHTQRWNKRHVFYIGTNGTILTDEIKNWLVKYRGCVFVGVSLDGNKEAHDINRSNSYDKLQENLPFFLKYWGDQPMKMTIGAETIHLVADSIIAMEESKYFFSTNIVFEDIWGDEMEKKRLLNIYAQQLAQLINYYCEHPNLFPVSILDRKPEHIAFATQNPNFKIGYDTNCVRYCGAGHEMIMIDVDGNEFPCHRFSTWVTGKLAPEIGELKANQQKAWKPDKCASCFLVNMCPTCAGFNWQSNNDSGVRSTFHCESYKLEVAASAKLTGLRLANEEEKIKAENDPKIIRLYTQKIAGIMYINENLDLSFLS